MNFKVTLAVPLLILLWVFSLVLGIAVILDLLYHMFNGEWYLINHIGNWTYLVYTLVICGILSRFNKRG